MKLIDKQIKAVEKTLEQVIWEYKEKIGHEWHCESCKLLQLIVEESDSFACLELREMFDDEATLEDIAGFLKSLLITLEEMR